MKTVLAQRCIPSQRVRSKENWKRQASQKRLVPALDQADVQGHAELIPQNLALLSATLLGSFSEQRCHLKQQRWTVSFSDELNTV